MTMCFIDTMAPTTPAEKVAWQAFLALPREYQRATKITFRRACAGARAADNMMSFLEATNIRDVKAMMHIAEALEALANEQRHESQ